jgi:hypothetical protein
MIETNIKMVVHGTDLFLWTKEIQLIGQNLEPKQTQTICSALQKVGVPAIPFSRDENYQSILIPASNEIEKRTLIIDNWPIELKDLNKSVKLFLNNPADSQRISNLFKRKLIYNINRITNLWKIKSYSNRIFYEEEPIQFNYNKNSDIGYTDIDAFRRYEISELLIDYAGLGFVIDVGVSFITNFSLDEYFNLGYKHYVFDLLNRQKEQKGSLILEGMMELEFVITNPPIKNLHYHLLQKFSIKSRIRLITIPMNTIRQSILILT